VLLWRTGPGSTNQTTGAPQSSSQPPPASGVPSYTPEPSDTAVYQPATIYVLSEGACSTLDHRSNHARGASALQLASDGDVCASLKRETEAALAEAGFAIITDRDQPHRYAATLLLTRTVTSLKDGGIIKTLHDLVSTHSRVTAKDQGTLVADVEVTSASDTDVEESEHARGLVDKLTAAALVP